MQFLFQNMREEDARSIASWHYEAPYDFYDMDQDPEDLAELLDPRNWHDRDYSVFDERDALVGFFAFQRQGEMLEIGLGLRPDLTGKGMGQSFLQAGLVFAQETFGITKFSLKVATFNRRAIRLYERAGFKPLNTFMQRTNGGEYEFLAMEKLL